MLNKRSSGVLKFIAYVVICSLANSGVSQEFANLPPEVLNDSGAEEVQAVVEDAPLGFSEEEAGVETLTRGPLHEAFAEPLVSDPVPGLIIPREPPESINEIAPDFRPEGDEAIWISGYWGWDEQRDDFIWISGVYRIPPDGHRWVPGYWHQVIDGWQWVQGLWVEEVTETISYLPPPPLTLENGPSSPSPGTDYFYIPGNWSQSSTGYLWNVGYWHPMQDDLIWVPSHTVWTPRGCIFVNGYWDRRLPLRGLCFAPVVVPRATFSRQGWYLRPNVVLDTQVVLHNLFVQPGYCHYLFGDYYGWPSTRRNVVPAYVYHQRRGSCDPLISFYTAYNARQGKNLIQWYGKQHAELRLNPSKRPPQHWSPINSNIKDQANHSNTEPSHMAHRLDQWNSIGEGPRITPITASVKKDLLKRDADNKRLASERETAERKSTKGSAESGGIVAATLALPKLEHITRKNNLESRVGKMPEQPRNSTTLLHQSSRARPVLPNEPRGFDSLKLPEQTRHESNRISNPLDTNRTLERLRQMDAPKISVPKTQAPPPILQSQVPKGVTPQTQFRSLPNRESGSQGKWNGENKNLRPKQLTPPSTPVPRLQINPPTTRSTPPSPPQHQPRQGNRSSNNVGSSGPKDHGKKPK